jgi:DNA-binding CsgD family transcriptional regulator
MRIREKQTEYYPLIASCFRRHTLASMLDESKVGVVICDRQLRYKALNQSVADIHNEPVRAHLGRPMRQILGNFADEIVPYWENVLSSGNSSTNLEIVGKLPKRSGMGRWVENLFPLKDGRGRVEQVGCFVIEIIPTPLSPNSRPPTHEKMKTRPGSQAPVPNAKGRVILSNREQEVLRLLAEGKTTKQIASALQISARTVETYRGRLMLKLQADSMVKLVHYAIQNCIIKL